MPYQPTTRLHLSGYRFTVRRLECALLRRDLRAVNEPLRARSVSLLVGGLLASIVVAGCAFLAVLRPQATLDHAQIVMGQESGALYVRVGELWHPVLNLASARLIVATDANPTPVREFDLGRTKRGPLLGIPGAPQHLGRVLSSAESGWTICDSDAATTVVVGRIDGARVRRLGTEQALVATVGSGSPVYLLYQGRRALVDLADPAVLRALRLEGHRPRLVSQALLNAVPEVPPLVAPRIPGTGSRAGRFGFSIGSVLRISRGDGQDYYVVLATGFQRIGQVAADLLRFNDSQGAVNVIAVAPDVIRTAPIVDSLPVSTFPDRAPAPLDDGDPTVCATWAATAGAAADIAFWVGSGPPVPAGQASMTLAQADGRGPALDAVYLAAGRSAYVRSGSLTGGSARAATRYLITDTGTRFAVHDDDAAHDLGLPSTAIPAPWPVLAELPSGPELSRDKALVTRDAVASGAP